MNTAAAPTPPSGLIIAAPASGAGKTTVTLALLRLLARQGMNVRGAKSGPDYIDPKFHEAACGQPCLNLDAWAMTPARLSSLATGDGTLVIEGAMGLTKSSSPAAHVRNATSPLLLMQGDADEEVDFQELIGIVRALRTVGRGENEVDVVVYPDEAHGLATYAHQMDAYGKMVAFLCKHLAVPMPLAMH